MPIQLTTQQDAEIRAHAAADYPHECCGFLIGKNTSEGVTVAYITHASNTRQDSLRNRFEIDPLEQLKVDKQARAEGLGVVGFYHSHPDAPARPSEYDRERAWPGYCYIIVSVVQTQPELMTVWLLQEDRSGFEEDIIKIR